MNHQTISFIKSGLRIIGYIMLPYTILAVAVLCLSEFVGIVEEVGQ